MARQTDGINGGFIGHVGTVIGYQWRGKWCMRSYPRHVRDAKTALQLAQREWFKLAVGLAASLTEVLRAGLRERSHALHMTEGNLFVALNKEYLHVQDGRLAVDYGSLTVSDGRVAPVGFGEVNLATGDRHFTVSVDFDRNPMQLPAQGGDKVYVAALCEGSHEAMLSVPCYRRSGRLTFLLPAYWQGKKIHLYGFVQDHTGDASQSQYLGSVEPDGRPERDVLFDGAGNLSRHVGGHLDVVPDVEATGTVERHKVDVDGDLSAIGSTDSHMVISSWSLYRAPKYP